MPASLLRTVHQHLLDIHVDPFTLARGGDAHEIADRLGNPAAPTDDLARLIRGDGEFVGNGKAADALFDLHGLVVIDKVEGDILEQRFHEGVS